MKNLRRVVIRTVLIIAALYLVAMGAVMAIRPNMDLFKRVMGKTPTVVRNRMIPMRLMFNIVRAGKMKIGDPATDFNLPTADNKEHVRLSSFRGQMPVALIFGSYT